MSHLVVISPDGVFRREHEIVLKLFDAGLERYHVRKPQWSAEQMTEWIEQIPNEWRSRLVLHSHHELVRSLRLGGRHWQDNADAPLSPPIGLALTSRSCHDLNSLAAASGSYDSVFLSPVFTPISKPDYRVSLSFETVSGFLHMRAGSKTSVLALGGVTVEKIAECSGMGFDGVAVLGAIWLSSDPIASFLDLQTEVSHYAA